MHLRSVISRTTRLIVLSVALVAVPTLLLPAPAAGVRVPAEWEPHTGTWLQWPYQPSALPNLGILAVFLRFGALI